MSDNGAQAGRDEPDHSRLLRPSQSAWGALLLVLVAVLVALIAGAAIGVWTLAGLCLVGAIARLFIPNHAPLAVRTRLVDAALLLAFAGALAFLAATTTLS